MDKFVLIGGMPRSGTNLARRIIGSHSTIAIPTAEFHFLKGYVQQRTVREILANERLRRWEIDFSDLYDDDPRYVYLTVLRRYAEKKGKSIPGEKSPGNEFYLQLAEEWLRDFELKCIVMMRNPLDVTASLKFLPSAHGKHENDPELVRRTAHDWCRSVRLGLSRSYARPQNYFLLKYEDLVSDPHASTNALCEFIGVDFQEDRMLSLADFSEHRDNTSFAEQDNLQQAYRVYKPASRKQYLSADDMSVVRDICGELAWAVGYEDDNLVPSYEAAPKQPWDFESIKTRIFRWSKHFVPQQSSYHKPRP